MAYRSVGFGLKTNKIQKNGIETSNSREDPIVGSVKQRQIQSLLSQTTRRNRPKENQDIHRNDTATTRTQDKRLEDPIKQNIQYGQRTPEAGNVEYRRGEQNRQRNPRLPHRAGPHTSSTGKNGQATLTRKNKKPRTLTTHR